MEVNWNVRLTKTAGFCTYKKQMPTATGRWAKIELSVKVCDSAERLRDTMIHEMCHAAVWLIHGQNDHHGPLWQLYARKSNRIHEDLTTISRCHTYEIQTKYTYKCNKCGYEIGRHSKSLDIEKKVCGYCRGTFEVFINTPRRTPKRAATNRTPNPFAQFVKDNYATLKRENPSLIHKDIMKKLSENFKK
ncbi:hypothetical protein CAPTEDRAFT_178344 [Capitella teleta]|uniref:SprT-like domain-containing protein n=1 Tax=Capitella teleta TaxID=283909 RepID=R7UZQ1_CAPTE|nr:hypothetical protein CAPTEDRAFT_178344 [Capitella teleta]|eukprot:ELU08921.1 hypothetical protein CAPTEDRAFT_178344 [Capitella teleta]